MNRDRPGWMTKISKWSDRHEIYFRKVILIIDFESELKIVKHFAI